VQGHQSLHEVAQKQSNKLAAQKTLGFEEIRVNDGRVRGGRGPIRKARVDTF